MKSISGKTSEQLLKTLPDWKRRKFIDFWNVGWRNGSKQQAVVSWDKAIPDPQTAEMVIERANDYEKNCRARDIPKTMALSICLPSICSKGVLETAPPLLHHIHKFLHPISFLLSGQALSPIALG